MMDSLVLIALAVVVVGGALAAIRLALTHRDARSAVVRRVDIHSVPVSVVESGRPIERINVLRDSAYGSGSWWSWLLRRFPPARTAERELRYAAITLGILPYLLIRLGVGALVGFVLFAVSGQPVLATGGAIAGTMIPRLAVKRQVASRRNAFEAQLAEALDLMTGSLRAGHGFLQAIESTSDEMKDPMKAEFQRMLEQINVGGNLVEALQGLTERIDSHDLKLLAAAIAVQRQSGGNLAEVLDNLANTVRERRRIRGEVKALTAAPRLSGLIVGLMPFGMAAYMLAVSADYRDRMLGTQTGNIMLAFAGVWTLLGFFITQKIAKVEY